MKTPSLGMAMVIVTLCVSTSLVWAQSGSDEGVGVFTAVRGAVTVTHPGVVRAQPVKLYDKVLWKDVIETRKESRTRAFFEDDSVLTVGENSRVEVTEYIYDPDRNMRQTVVKLFQGKLRALVGKVFTGSGSKFEIHTPTAVAAARGTYFVVWTEDGMTGIVNIGQSGRVDFTSAGHTVTVAPGEYSVAAPGKPPTPPAVYNADPKVGAGPVVKAERTTTIIPAAGVAGRANGIIGSTLGNTTGDDWQYIGQSHHLADQSSSMLASVMNAIEGTVLKDEPRPESALETIRGLALAIPTIPTMPGILNVTSSPDRSVTTQTTPSTQSIFTLTVAPLAPVTSVVSTTPLDPLVSSVTTPLTPLVSSVTAPLTPLISSVTAPLAPVISPVTAPLAPITSPVTTTVPVTPPAVISGAVNTLTKTLK